MAVEATADIVSQDAASPLSEDCDVGSLRSASITRIVEDLYKSGRRRCAAGDALTFGKRGR